MTINAPRYRAVTERVVEAVRRSGHGRTVGRRLYIVPVTEPADSGIRHISRRVLPCRRRLPRGSVGRGDPMTRKASRCRAAGEIGAMAGLTGAETLHGRDARQRLCCGSMCGRHVPASGMSYLAVAKRIVKTAHRHRQDNVGRRLPVRQVTKSASGSIGHISRRVLPCRRRLPWEGVGRIHSSAMTGGRVQTSGRGGAGEIGAMASLTGTETLHGRGTRR